MDKGQKHKNSLSTPARQQDDFVLDKDIFSNIFDKDIRRVYIYKKAERLAKALHAIAPAFAGSTAMKNRLDQVAVALVDAALAPPAAARAALAHELLTLSSMLSVARTGSLLSPMNADLIAREARLLLQEAALYEEPRLAFDESPTLAALAKSTSKIQVPSSKSHTHFLPPKTSHLKPVPHKGHLSDIKDKPHTSDRRETVLAVVREKGHVYIKDISTVIRGVSEKTVQRELQALIKEGILKKEGERRWTLYSLA